MTFDELADWARNQPDAFCDVPRQDCVAACRAYLESTRAAIRERHNQGASGTDTVHALSELADNMAEGVYHFALAHSPHRRVLRRRLAMCAFGGYGRHELCPFSDLDVSLLYEGEFDDDVESLNGFIVPFLWDLGFSVGYALRSVQETCELALEDLESLTSVWQGRMIAGNPMVFAQLKLCVREQQARAVMRGFIEQLLIARQADLPGEFSDLYDPEPNVKENKGGLRDFQTGLWLFMMAYGATNLDEVAAQGRLTEDEHLQLRASLDFVWRIRNELHWHAGRAEDVLTYEHQEHIARAFGYGTDDEADVARLMADYYAAARSLRRFLRIGARSWTSASTSNDPEEPASTAARHGIRKVGGEIVAGDDDPRWFVERPSRLMEVFWRSAQMNTRIAHVTDRAITENVHLMTDSVRSSDLVRRFFVAICGHPLRAGHVFRQMFRTGLLGEYLPELKAVGGVIRYEDFHSFPVDEHTVRAIEALALLEDRDDPVSRCLRVCLEHLSDPHILVLAILFHDLGKVEGDVHTEASERITWEIGNRIGLSKEETEHIAFLVRHHILMTHLSQYRDIDDEEVIRGFAETMQTEQRLRELFLLSYADLHAVGPNVWNEWKGTLLMKLYLRAERILVGRADDPSGSQYRDEKTRAVLDRVDPSIRDAVEPTLQSLGTRYAFAFTPEQIARHMACMAQAKSEGLAVACHTAEDLNSTEVVVCAKDRRGRFAQLAGCFAAQLVNVRTAALFTVPDGYVLDTFLVRNARRDRALTPAEIDALAAVFHQVVRDGDDVAPLVDRARNRLFSMVQRSFPMPTQIRFDNASSSKYTVIDVETGDRTGLLYDIATAMNDHGLDIATARIVTDARRVRDAFYVTLDGNKLDNPEQHGPVRAAIHGAIHPRAAVEA